MSRAVSEQLHLGQGIKGVQRPFLADLQQRWTIAGQQVSLMLFVLLQPTTHTLACALPCATFPALLCHIDLHFQCVYCRKVCQVIADVCNDMCTALSVASLRFCIQQNPILTGLTSPDFLRVSLSHGLISTKSYFASLPQSRFAACKQEKVLMLICCMTWACMIIRVRWCCEMQSGELINLASSLGESQEQPSAG